MKEELKLYIKNNLLENFEKKSLKSSPFLGKKYSAKEECCCADISIDSYINNNKDEAMFQTLLFKYIDDRNLKDSDVYNKVHIDRRLFSKIRSDVSYHPSKDTIILLGFSLELSEDEIVKLLEAASYSLPKNNYYDLIIRFCFINKIYKIDDVNNLLEEYNCKLFSY